MQFRFLPSLIVFLGSYLPLAAILLAQDVRYSDISKYSCLNIFERNTDCQMPLDNAGYSLTIFIVCLACFLFSIITLAIAKPNIPVDITEARYTPAELMNYTLPYVVSFMNLDYQQTGKFVGLMIFLIWMFWITYKSGQLILNPMLTAFGWRHYEVTYRFPGNDEYFIGQALSRHPLTLGRHNQTSIQEVLIFRKNNIEE